MSRTLRKTFSLAAVSLLALTSSAQTAGPGNKDNVKQPRVRATAVYEWTGDLATPGASRLVPVAVFDGENYQPGGLYMSQPEPMALDPGTVYQLEKAGLPEGTVEVDQAQRMNMPGLGVTWFGTAKWKPQVAPGIPKLQVSRVAPQVVHDVDSDRPHFKGAANATPKDTASTQDKASDSKAAGSPEASTKPPPPDPDRPTLRKRVPGEQKKSPAADTTAPVTATRQSDPDRPRLARGKPAADQAALQPAKLTGMPEDRKQMVAYSDVRNEEPRSYLYQWARPEDAVKAEATLRELAQKAVAPPRVAVRPRVEARSPLNAGPRRPPLQGGQPMLPHLAGEDFHAYELAWSGGATLVYSAKTTDAPVKYVTLIAEPDFYGNPRVLLQRVASEATLDETPRMRLVDAIDADGDGRAELLFELRSASDRQFALYRVMNGTAVEVFNTGPQAH